MTWRLPEDPRLREFASRPLSVWRDRRNRVWVREVVWAVSAGELLDDWSHWQRWKRGSAAGQCELYGGRRNWNRDE